jgi:hypothetical protein
MEHLARTEYDRIQAWYISHVETHHREPGDLDLFNKLIRMQRDAVKESLDRADMEAGK